MDTRRLKMLSRTILADVLRVGNALTAGPVLTEEQEGEILDAIEVRVLAIAHRDAGASDDELARKFREEHPDLFQGSRQERHGVAKRLPPAP